MRTEDEFGWEGMTGRSCGGAPLGDFKVSENEGTKSRWHKNGKVCGWDGFITTIVNLVPYSQLIPCHVISGTGTC